MSLRFHKKVVVVIGGNSGIGLASAKAFAMEGAQLIITGRDPGRLRESVSDIGHDAIAYCTDITDLRQVRTLFEKLRETHGRVDVLFVNAGVLAVMPVEAVTEDDWDWLQDTNLKGAFFCAQAALPLMTAGSS